MFTRSHVWLSFVIWRNKKDGHPIIAHRSKLWTTPRSASATCHVGFQLDTFDWTYCFWNLQSLKKTQLYQRKPAWGIRRIWLGRNSSHPQHWIDSFIQIFKNQKKVPPLINGRISFHQSIKHRPTVGEANQSLVLQNVSPGIESGDCCIKFYQTSHMRFSINLPPLQSFVFNFGSKHKLSPIRTQQYSSYASCGFSRRFVFQCPVSEKQERFWSRSDADCPRFSVFHPLKQHVRSIDATLIQQRFSAPWFLMPP